MKRFVITFGIVLAVTILMSGSAVAPWIQTATGVYCTNPTYAENAPDAYLATAGQSNPSKLGTLTLDFGENPMPPSTLFWVVGGSSENESYGVGIRNTDLDEDSVLGIGWDGNTYYFTTPSMDGKLWQWVLSTGATGVLTVEDPIYGPEINAVGW